MLIKKIKLLKRIKWLYQKYFLKKKIALFKIKEFEIFLDLITPGISKTLAIYGSREDDMKFLISKYLKKDMNVLDCGSNIGFYPIYQRNIIGNNSKIFCFEPDDRNYELLKKNIDSFDKSQNTFIYKKGLAENNEEKNIIITDESNLNTISTGNDEKFFSKYKVNELKKIECISIDSFIAQINTNIDFIRMDIEGYEVEVLRGMRNTLSKMKPRILIEIHPHFYDKQRDFSSELTFLFNQGYSVRALISAQKPQPIEFKSINLNPLEIINSDFIQRGYYENINNSDAIHLVNVIPKIVRYVYLESKN
ncbi:FkbM family methyltransferase [Alphaproteobacteria bacterium]|nr:FkbM family methyltransferase [Alphaproteobacteria bacterium]